MKQLIFVVEDEIEVSELAQWCLEEAGYAVRLFSTSNVIQDAEDGHPSLLLITMMMPDGNGLDLCRQIRENRALARTPIVFLIPESAEEHRALALESGADDCIVKPFSPRELVARVQAVLRRFAPANGRSRVDSADLVIDSLAMKLSVRGSEVPITSLEFRLIEYLARHRGQVFTRDLLLDAVWGDMQASDTVWTRLPPGKSRPMTDATASRAAPRPGRHDWRIRPNAGEGRLNRISWPPNFA
jgi:two-component system phosphate regulon response regulator PhoB